MPAKLKVARCGDTLYVFDEVSEAKVEAAIAKRLLKGDARTSGDGTREWIDDEMVVDTSKQAAEQYTWAADGNRVLHERVKYTLHRDGRRERKVLRKIYKAFE